MAAELDEQVQAFRTRPLDAGPYTFVAADALVLKVREGGRVVRVHALVATAVNGDGHREILGLHVTSAEDGSSWPGSSATWSPAACSPPDGSGWSPPTPTPVWSPRSPPPSRGPAGNAVAPTMRRT
jgi:hypothetical protein